MEFTTKNLKDVFGVEFIEASRRHGIDTTDPYLLYELKGSTIDMSPEDEDEFLKVTARRMTPGQTRMGNYPFLSFFANPHFKGEFKQEMLDIVRRQKGPTLQKGIVKCRKCKSDRTISEERFTRSADEASRMVHSCEVCKEFWTT